MNKKDKILAAIGIIMMVSWVALLYYLFFPMLG